MNDKTLQHFGMAVLATAFLYLFLFPAGPSRDFFIAISNLIIGFYWGSSEGSRRKDNAPRG